MKIWRDKINILKAIWGDRYPFARPRKHSLIEKLLCTLAILACLLSLSGFKELSRERVRKSHLFMDIYILIWAAAGSLILFSGWLTPSIGSLIFALYRIIDIVGYRVFYLLVKSQEKPWTEDVLRRSLAIAVINFYEIVSCFAIIYIYYGCIAHASDKLAKLQTAGEAFYFSLVTMTTVGYGDFVPVTTAGRLLVIAQLATMIVFLLFVLPALVSVFSSSLTRTDETRKNSI